MSIEYIMIISAILLFVSVLASKALTWFGIPSLLCFLGIGMLAGSEGVGRIYFDNAELTQSIGVTALAFILFAGGLDTKWLFVRGSLKSAMSLATIGVLITSIIFGLFALAVLDIEPLDALLFGAIISSTDAAAVFGILHGQKLRLKGRLAPLLELESGFNDPMAVFLTIGLTNLLAHPDSSLWSFLLLFFQQMGFGAICGFVFGKIGFVLLTRLRLAIEGLYPVLTIALVLFTFGFTDGIGGSGFLAVYIAGLMLGNSVIPHQDQLTRFHDGLAWLMQIVMFLALGLLVYPSRLPGIALIGLSLAAFLIFVARPASVLIALAFSHFTLQEKLFVSWVGLRGAVPIVLATFPLLERLPRAPMVFNLVFFIVLTSVLLQGSLLPLCAKKLGLIEE